MRERKRIPPGVQPDRRQAQCSRSPAHPPALEALHGQTSAGSKTEGSRSETWLLNKRAARYRPTAAALSPHLFLIVRNSRQMRDSPAILAVPASTGPPGGILRSVSQYWSIRLGLCPPCAGSSQRTHDQEKTDEVGGWKITNGNRQIRFLLPRMGHSSGAKSPNEPNPLCATRVDSVRLGARGQDPQAGTHVAA